MPDTEAPDPEAAEPGAPAGPVGPGAARAVRRPGEMRRENLSTVLDAVMRGPVARSDISRSTGMAPATVTALVNQLLELRLVREYEPSVREIGRPRVPVGIDDTSVVLGVHIGLRGAGLAVIALDGRRLASGHVFHRSKHPERITTGVAAAANALLEEAAPRARVLGTGVATAGVVDRSAGVVVDNPVLGWRDIPLAAWLGSRLPGPVMVEQDVHASALAQLHYGAGRVHDDFAVMVVTAGVGLSMVTDRRLRRGASGRAGNLRHLRVTDRPAVPCPCGGTRCFGANAADSAVLDQAGALGLAVRNIDALIAAAANGDSRATRPLTRRARLVGRAVATVIDLLDPPSVVLLGSLSGDTPREAVVRREAAACSEVTGASARLVLLDQQHWPTPLATAAATPVVDRLLADPAAVAGT
ncbi:ROK family protein [Streptomyces sp. NPDC048445]|uniref:ROK family protein n=1 Tax=Streptomyces sp. NPDC048445 TaxID=3365553 RepID=UPI0037135E99